VLFYRSKQAHFGDSGWIIADADFVRSGDGVEHAGLSWVRVEDVVVDNEGLCRLFDLPFNTGIVCDADTGGIGLEMLEFIDERQRGESS